MTETPSANLSKPARGTASSLLIAVAAILASMLAVVAGARCPDPLSGPQSPIFPSLCEGDFSRSAGLLPPPRPTPAVQRGGSELRAASGAPKHCAIGAAPASADGPTPVAYAEPGRSLSRQASTAAMAKCSRGPPRF